MYTFITMKNITKIIAVGVFALALVLGGQAMAQETDANAEVTVDARISELRAIHADLKAQVEAGTLTVEEAREKWQALIAEARTEKEAFFEKKRAQIEDRYQQMVENNPERAEIFKEHIEGMRDRHQARVEKRTELRAKVEAGEITRQDANRMRVEFVKTQRDNFQELRANVKEKRQDLRERRQDNRSDIRDERPDARAVNGYIKIDDVKGEVQDRANPNRPAVRPAAGAPNLLDSAASLGAQGRLDINRPPVQVRPVVNVGANGAVRPAVRATDYNSSRSNKSY